ncbi:MAG: serine/threonine-protein kinase [Spirosomataceae bacterium]
MSYIGKNIRGYRITEFLGAGGMGEVYKAEHQTLGRTAAVKLLFQREQTARFQNEAYIQASVRHPNIASLYEFTTLDDKPCIIMEFVPGVTLDQYVMKKGKLPNAEAKRIFQQVAEAIAYLHQQQILHRDIKPSNIKLMPDGTVKLLDFGIAKASYSPKLTQEGFVIGTSEFMAPEQFRHRPELKSDIWALGILLYFLTTGFLPFEDSNPLSLRHKIEQVSFTSPQILNANLSKELHSTIYNCLKYTPSKRPSAEQLAKELSGEHPLLPRSFLTQQWQLVNQHPWAKWAVLGVVGLVLMLFSITGSNSTDEPLHKEVINVRVTNTNHAELILPTGKVLKGNLFTLEREKNKPLTFTLRDGEFVKSFTIEADYHDSTYSCTMDF